MNKHNIIFISGLSIPKCLAKTKLVWNDSLWNDYNRYYVSNYLPTSDLDAKRKLNELKELINSLSNPIIISQSLGAWWTANLACMPECDIKKVIMMTPLANAKNVPFFNTSSLMYPIKNAPVVNGPHRVLVCQAKYDLICPVQFNGSRLIKHFNAMSYDLNGGHFYQSDHTSCLKFMQDWIEV